MLFNSWVFVLFFILVYLLYLRLGDRGQNWVLLIASYIFYGAWDWRFLGLLALSTVVDYCCGLWIAGARSAAVRRGILIVSMSVSLGILGFFKYCDFFIENFAALLHMLGLATSLHTLNIILPVGISFYTFQTMSYTIDVYRGQMPPCRRLSDFALFVSFFPQLVAGPIERATNLVRQVEHERVLNWPQVRSGLWLLVQGYFLKVVVADNAAPIADAAFNAPAATGGTALLGIYAFAMQIYGDFAGYSSIARGLAKLMGFELMVNFRQPYLAVSPSDFWQRWHISLSTWLRDYLYIPLGGNRSGPAQTYRNLMLTMLLGGLWHGAHWRFVIWGFYHGLLLVLFRRLSYRRPAGAHVDWLRPLRVIAFFQLTCVGWLIFRCNSIEQIWTFPAAIVRNFAWSAANQDTSWVLLFLGLPALALDLYDEYGHAPPSPETLPRPARGWRVLHAAARLAAATLMLAMLFVCGVRGGTQFIYFQF